VNNIFKGGRQSELFFWSLVISEFGWSTFMAVPQLQETAGREGGTRKRVLSIVSGNFFI
jgi:hypothetical protein